jgi:hypothetical protein
VTLQPGDTLNYDRTGAWVTDSSGQPRAANPIPGVANVGGQLFLRGSGKVPVTSLAVAGLGTGDKFDCLFANLGGGQTLTITGATGSTVKGTAAVPSGKNALLTFENTGANAWDIYAAVSA